MRKVQRKAKGRKQKSKEEQLKEQLTTHLARLRDARRAYEITRRRAEMAGVAPLESEEADAGIPPLDVRWGEGDELHLFIGGLDDPQHGHWIVDATAEKIVYRRDYGEYRGWWNHRSPLVA